MAELLDIATRVAGWANDGEHVEAYVVHERDTEARAYDGKVEAFTSAESRGIGVSVVVDGKQGYAYAGTLDEDALHETLREARDNAAFAEQGEVEGERVAAFVVAPDGFDLETCRGWFAERGAAKFVTPERIEVIDEMPVLASGKVDRAALVTRLG